MGARAGGGEGVATKGQEGILRGDGPILNLDYAEIILLYVTVNTLNCTLIMVNFTVYKLYFRNNKETRLSER